MKLKFKVLVPLILFVILGGLLFNVSGVFAETATPTSSDDFGLEYMNDTNLGKKDIRDTIASVINILLGFLGTLMVLLILYGGFLYMTSNGEQDKIETAKKIIINAVIGALIILASWGITYWIFKELSKATGLGLVNNNSDNNGSGTFTYVDSAGIIDSHYPNRDATNIPRNTKIIVTFKEKMDLSTIVDIGDPEDSTDDVIMVNNIKINKTTDEDIFVTDVRAFHTDDLKTFVFDPVPLLGNSKTITNYTIILGSGLRTFNGDKAFADIGEYSWQFDVSTVVDNIPPKIINVIPKVSIPPTTVARNIAIQIVFDEAIDPTSASGFVFTDNENTILTKFNNIIISHNENNILNYVPGTFSISNQYRTIEFLTDDLCGVNSCGEDVFCLPPDKLLNIFVKAASLSNEPPAAFGFPYDGVVDVAGNSLDGNGDGIASGPLGDNNVIPPIENDNYEWNFNTNNIIDLTPPEIAEVAPGRFATMVPLNSLVSALFTKPLLMKTLIRSNVFINDIYYYIESEPIGDTQTNLFIKHNSKFADNFAYTPVLTSGIKDLYQNCFYNADKLDNNDGCVGPEDSISDTEITDLKKKTDLILIAQAVEEYKDKVGGGKYKILNGAGWMNGGNGYVANEGGGYYKSILSELYEQTSLKKENLNFPDSNRYLYYICGQGRTFSLSTSLQNPEPNLIDVNGNDLGNFASYACNGSMANGIRLDGFDNSIDTHYGKNYAVTNFGTSNITGLWEGRDDIRKQDLIEIKKAVESYKVDAGDYPLEAGDCVLTSSTDFKTSLTGYLDIPSEPIYRDTNKSYRYYNVGDGYVIVANLEDVNSKEISNYSLTECVNSPVYNYCVGRCDLISNQ